MRKLSAEVVVIGGGATGVGVARDAAMRGYSTILVERADLAQGTTGRFHGLLHSGGRYVVSDPESATECAEENAIVSRIHADAVERTGGLFVCAPGDDPGFADKFLAGASAQKVPAQEITLSEALRREPRLNPGITRAIEVQDGTVDGWRMVWGAAESAKAHGATVLTYHDVTAIQVEDGHTQAVFCHNRKTGEDVTIDCGFVVNAAGPWAGHVAAMAGCHDVEVVPGRGIMVAMNHRLVNTVINRCIYPSDGDILVPVHTVCIIGTTDHPADDPDHLEIPADEVQQMLSAGEVLIPGFRQSRAVHAWAGARPLVKDHRVSASDTRHMSRGMAILDHDARDGVKGMVTIAGGKLTTYRLMAKNTVDLVSEQLGDNRPCTTDQEPVPTATSGINYTITHRLADREAERPTGPLGQQTPNDLGHQVVCECELVSRGMLVDTIAAHPDAQFDDWRRLLRIGMGPCQGGFCALRTTGIAVERKAMDAAAATALMRLFIAHRWIGLWPILFGAQVRQTVLDSWIFSGLLDLDSVPVPAVPPAFTPPGEAAAAKTATATDKEVAR
ncbi:MAG: anaerobic glycerol-3-phosphate dehydrogenase subunit GlpA [Propionibacteriaceae bacterium]|nr:anaerobic glycerol-3-phosphate dehydrogenase subunit GlpA [Propionibacteriaceae bacterium]